MRAVGLCVCPEKAATAPLTGADGSGVNLAESPKLSGCKGSCWILPIPLIGVNDCHPLAARLMMMLASSTALLKTISARAAIPPPITRRLATRRLPLVCGCSSASAGNCESVDPSVDAPPASSGLLIPIPPLEIHQTPLHFDRILLVAHPHAPTGLQTMPILLDCATNRKLKTSHISPDCVCCALSLPSNQR